MFESSKPFSPGAQGDVCFLFLPAGFPEITQVNKEQSEASPIE
jgi:hypothetical protein